MKKIAKVAIAAAIVAVVGVAVPVVHNQVTPATYESLSETDRAMLDELDTLSKWEGENSLWAGFKMTEKTIFSLKSFFFGGYLVNPASEPSAITSKKVDMPASSSLTVYRTSGCVPDLLPLSLPPKNFNTYGETFNVQGNNVYFVRYGDDSFGKSRDSGHFTTMLAHEAFHYYAQEGWAGMSRPNTDLLQGSDLDLLEVQYVMLDGMADLLDFGRTRDEGVVELVGRYIAATDKRIAANPEYMKEELQAETMEGSATYVGIKASEAVGYDFGIMRWNSAEQGDVLLSFGRIASLIKEGTLSADTIGSEWVYQSGALQCAMLDMLGCTDWQDKLNAQTANGQVTTYELLKAYYETVTVPSL